ncbi:MAG TPA: DUF2079 domain-containing protein [Candidatus Bathyarchaeia archaeon]
MNRSGRPDCRVLVYASILVYVVVLTGYTLAKHAAFKTYAWDLGIFGQSFWTTVNVGGVFRNNCELHLVESGSFFGVHFSPILFLILPLYVLRQDVTTLLAVQSLALGLSAYPVYLMGRECVGERTGAVIAATYLLNPGLHGVNCYDFHVQALLPLTLNYMILYTRRGQWAKATAAATLSLSVMEQVTNIVIVFALATIASRLTGSKPVKPRAEHIKALAFAATLILLSLTWGALSAHVIHLYNPVVSDYLKAGRHFTVLGAGEPSEVPTQAITQPRRAVEALTYDAEKKAAYLLAILSPSLFTSLAEPLTLAPAAAWLAVSLLSNYPPYYTLGFQYLAYVTPFTQAAATIALMRLRRAPRRQMAAALAAAAVASTLALSPLSPMTDGFDISPAYRKPAASQGTRLLAEVLGTIPGDASILTQDNIFPHVCGRADAYVIPPDTGPGSGAAYMARQQVAEVHAEYVLVDLETDPLGTAREAAQAAEDTGLYRLITSEGGLRLYRIETRGIAP